MKKLIATVALALVSLGIIAWAGFGSSGVYHDGRCGAEKFVMKFFWSQHDTDNSDEFGIPHRWRQAHAGECEHIWVRGNLGPNASPYWPWLHFRITIGAPSSGILAAIAPLDRAQVHKTDAFGRTLMHWAVIYPNPEEREKIKRALMEKGLSMDDRDNDGLSPADWEAQFDRAPSD